MLGALERSYVDVPASYVVHRRIARLGRLVTRRLNPTRPATIRPSRERAGSGVNPNRDREHRDRRHRGCLRRAHGRGGEEVGFGAVSRRRRYTRVFGTYWSAKRNSSPLPLRIRASAAATAGDLEIPISQWTRRR